ncbi:MAG: alpha/beta fold hydrolase, partial [Verrucomicrobia bacterium]|nr:alpha/beta fold hydrolase [Verrucomicrobiota bacterium]
MTVWRTWRLREHWHKKSQVLASVSLLFATGGAFLVNVVAFNHAKAMLHFTQHGLRTKNPEALSVWEKAKVLAIGVEIPRPQARSTPADFDMPFQERVIQCSNGIKLGAWYVPRENASSMAVLFHGYAADKSSLLAEAKALHEMGLSELMVDFRGSGTSSESYTSIGYYEAEDVAETLRYVGAHLPHTKLVLFGQSMGAAAVLRAIHQRRAAPDAVILDSVFDTMLQTVKNRFQSMGVPSFPSAELLVFWGGEQLGFNAFRHNPVD